MLPISNSTRLAPLEGGGVDYVAVAHLSGYHVIPGLIDLLAGNYLYLGRDIFLGAKVQYFLGEGDTTDIGAGQRFLPAY